jgi:hypothetical protein
MGLFPFIASMVFALYSKRLFKSTKGLCSALGGLWQVIGFIFGKSLHVLLVRLIPTIHGKTL